jgi:hypothetical protein
MEWDEGLDEEGRIHTWNIAIASWSCSRRIRKVLDAFILVFKEMDE